jgi:hypothetical protein
LKLTKKKNSNKIIVFNINNRTRLVNLKKKTKRQIKKKENTQSKEKKKVLKNKIDK